MTRKTYGIIGLTVLMFIFIMRGMFKVSTDDIDTNKILEQERIKVEETLSGMNLQLSGYSSGWLEQEKIIVNAKAEQKKIEEKANIIKYRKRIYENKKNGIDMIIGTEEVKKEVEKEAINIIPKAKADYEGETEYERVRNQIIKLGVSYEIAEHITREAYANTSGAKEFIRNIIGVSNAESTIFTRCNNGKNNCLGVMLNGTLKYYPTLKDSITDWRVKRNKNRWIVRVNASQRLKGKYCVGDCGDRVGNYNYAVNKLDI